MAGASGRADAFGLSSMMVATAVVSLLLVIGMGGCSSSVRSPVRVTDTARPTEPCDIAAAALRAVIQPTAQVRFGLDKACVQKYATHADKIYVDARFWNQERLQEVTAPVCEREGFVIRFDWKNFEPSPAADDVVVLSFWYRQSDLWEVKAAIEDRMWPQRLPEIEPLGHCPVAWGAVRRGPTGWQGLVIRPAQP